MTLPYIENFVLDFSPAQRRAMEDLVQRAKDGKSIGLDEVNALAAQISSGTAPMFQKPTFGAEIINGCKIATALESIRIDLTTMYSQLRDLEILLTQRDDIHKSTLDKLHQAVLRLDEMLLTHKFRRLNPNYTEIKVEDFVSAQNDARTPNRAQVESDSGQLISGAQESIEYLPRTGALRVKYEVTVLAQGLNPDRKTTFLPDAARTKNSKYVWAEVLLADSILTSTYETVSYDGVVVLFDILLPEAEDVNEIKMAPFGRFETKLIKAQYLDGEDWIDIPEVSETVLDLDTSVLRFATISSRAIRLVLLKEGYRFNHYAMERGQVKRANWLNIALAGSLETAVNDQSTLPRELKADRLDRATAALSNALTTSDENSVLDKYRVAIADVLAPDDREIQKVSKFEYILGLKALEVNYKRYADRSDFVAKPLQATGSVFEITIRTFESHPTFNDGTADANITSIQHSIDIGGGREIPFLPEGTSTIESERLLFDANRVSRTRFNVSASPSIIVRRDGLRLITSDYSTVVVTGEQAAITIKQSAWNVTAKYNVSYNPLSGQDIIKLLDIYDSIKSSPQEFTKTDRNNRISLPSHPFVLREIVNDKRRWSQPDPREARWVYRGPNTRALATDDPYVIRIDGENYGRNPTATVVTAALAIGGNSVEVELAGGAGNEDGAIPSEGVIRIEDELIYYTNVVVGTNVTLEGLVRGYLNTSETAHTTTTPVEWETRESYEPIIVKVNGSRCLNRTDYNTGVNPAFTSEETTPEYVQIGSTLYFDRPISGRIEVKYNRLADFLTLKARLFSDLASKEFTPVLDCLVLKLNTATI